MLSEGKDPPSADLGSNQTDNDNSTESQSLDGDNDSVAIKEGSTSIKKSVAFYCLIMVLGYAILTVLIIIYNVNGKGKPYNIRW